MSERDKLINSFTGDRPGLSGLRSNIPKGDVETVNSLHNQIATYIDKSIQNAILIGEILDRNKKQLGHGKFTSWFESSGFHFTLRQGQRYLYIFENQDKLKTTRVSSLRDALKFLSESESEEKEINPLKRKPAEIYKDFKEGKTLSKADKSALRDWLHSKVESYKSKASEIEKEIRKI